MSQPKIKEQLVSVPLNSLIIAILGSELDGWSDAPIPADVATVLDHYLKDSLLWKVEWEPVDESDKRTMPRLWRYKDWFESNQRWLKQKAWSEKERIGWMVKDKNVSMLVKVLIKSSGLREEDAKKFAYTLIAKNNEDILKIMGMAKIAKGVEDL